MHRASSFGAVVRENVKFDGVDLAGGSAKDSGSARGSGPALKVKKLGLAFEIGEAGGEASGFRLDEVGIVGRCRSVHIVQGEVSARDESSCFFGESLLFSCC